MEGKIETVFDIIIGDFGRLASAQYVMFLSEIERQKIQESKHNQSCKFFDEERRIMFDLCCEIAWFKRSSIDENISKMGLVTKDVLYGIGPASIGNEIVERGVQLVSEKILHAIERKYRKIRIYAVCNGLSELVRDIVRECASLQNGVSSSKGAQVTESYMLPEMSTIEFYSVPSVVAKSVVRSNKESPILILGTKGVNELYEKEIGRSSGSVYPLGAAEYALIDDAIVAAIGNNPSELRGIKNILKESLIDKYRIKNKNGYVIEACTDFEFGLGVNSLRIFADEMVLNVYGKG